MPNVFSRIRYLTAGESHGPKLTAIVEGFPANLKIDFDELQFQLTRRQTGYGSGGRMAIEKDRVFVSGGVVNGLTTGGPISLEISNKDWQNWRAKTIKPMTKARPGHCDLVAGLKYQFSDLRFGLERSSARETAMRVAVGALSRQLLGQLGLKIGGFVRELGATSLGPVIDVFEERSEDQSQALLDFAAVALNNELACPLAESVASWRNVIHECMKARDTLGGVVQVFATGLPVGLGSYVDPARRLDARIAMAMLSVPAMKGVEIGPAFQNSRQYGSAVHDSMFLDNDSIKRSSNKAGGFEAGMTTGQCVDVRVAMKPISTILKGLETIDLVTGESAPTTYERSDFCAIARAVPILEAMLAIVLCDAVLEEFGGSHMASLVQRFEQRSRLKLQSFPLKNEKLRLNYEGY